MIGSLLGAVALLVFGAPLSAQIGDKYPHSIGERGFTGVSIFTDQDLLDPWRNMDRNYTMGAGIGLTGAVFSGFSAWPNRIVLGFADPGIVETFLTKHELYLVGSGFTPDSLGSVVPVIGDRPYGSIFGLSNRRVVVPIHMRDEPDAEGEYEYYPVAIRTEVVLGLLGAGVSASIQPWIHEHNSSVVPLGRHNEISDGGEPTALFKIQYERRLTSCIFGDGQPCGHFAPYQRRHFEVTTWVEGLAGYYTGAAAGIRGRFGLLSSEFWDFDGSPGSTIGQATGGGNSPQNRFELYGFVNMNGRGVLYNALLQGQFKSNPYELTWSQINKGIAEFQTGAVISIPLGSTWRFGLGYLYSGRTREFSGAHARAHTYGAGFVTVAALPTF